MDATNRLAARPPLDARFQPTALEQLWMRLRRLRYQYLRSSKFQYLKERRERQTNPIYSCRPFDERRCIFVHIPKCAGISVCQSLFGNIAGGHDSIRSYQLMFSPHEFSEYFKFAFVRNPWDRLVSAYLYLKEGGRVESDRAVAAKSVKPFKDFEDFVRRGITQKPIRKVFHFRPQVQFICLLRNRPALDFIGRFETLNEDFAYITRRLNVQATLQQLNRTASKQRDYREYYTEETARIVGEVYADDVKVLGYSFTG